MTVYHKLVRDKIPQIIEASGETPIVKLLDESEHIACLEAKLDEEVAEYHRDHNAEELADILEVVFALAQSLDVSEKELLALRARKREQRGGFDGRIFLVGKESCTENRGK